MDFTVLYWIPLDFAICILRLHYILVKIWTPLDSTGLSAVFYTKLDSTGLDWTPLMYSTQNWTPLDCQLLLTQNWTDTLGSLIIQSPPPLPLLQLQDLWLHLICIPHQHLYYHPPPVKPPHVISNISPNTKLDSTGLSTQTWAPLDSTKLYAIFLALLNTFLMIYYQLLLLRRYSIRKMPIMISSICRITFLIIIIVWTWTAFPFLPPDCFPHDYFLHCCFSHCCFLHLLIHHPP